MVVPLVLPPEPPLAVELPPEPELVPVELVPPLPFVDDVELPPLPVVVVLPLLFLPSSSPEQAKPSIGHAAKDNIATL